MSHEHDSPQKLEIITHAALPLLLMLLIQMAANYIGSPANTIFLSPYLLAFFTACIIGFIVLWKGQICPGQAGRLTAILPIWALFSLGNLAYSYFATPNHSPLLMANTVAVLLPLLYWKFPDDEQFARILARCGMAMAIIGGIIYALVFWVELPSQLNWVRANNFAQLLCGVLLAGWYLMLAKSRLDGFFKLLILLALILLILNYGWAIFMLYLQMSQPDFSFTPYLIFFAVQFVILATLAWLLLGKGDKQIKNPVGWSVAMFLSLLYPLVNVI